MRLTHVFLGVCLLACTGQPQVEEEIEDFEIRFKSVSNKYSGISFVNKVNEFNTEVNLLSYFQFYDGAGVALGDLDNDGLTDIFFQSSYEGGELYRNRGKLMFEQVKMDQSLFNLGAVGTGVNLVDINNDGLLDIYLCYMGPRNLPAERKTNRLLINQGGLKFVESAAQYGLDNQDNSVQSSFFDYDKDGDLDMYLVNTNSVSGLSSVLIKKEFFDFNNPTVQKFHAQDRLFRNDGNGHFEDVTQSAGLKPEIFHGFNATIGDYNNDSWPDIYVSNDFYTPDLLYINNGDGTFVDAAEEYFKHTSYFSMGADAGDLNNDGLDDIIVADMTPEDYRRARRNMGMVDSTFFNGMVANGYGRQYMHNMLHLNTGREGFREISQFAGIDKTDWSWAMLMGDFDNDGLKDIYVTNGIGREIMDKDAHFRTDKWLQENSRQGSFEDFKKLVESFPSTPIPNYLFSNRTGFAFEDVSKSANVDIPSFSQGAATADLDNDGDLDLVVNNFNQEAFLLENTSNGGNFIQFKLNGPENNPRGIGAKVTVNGKAQKQYSRMYVSRGYMSSTDYRLHFGLGPDEELGSVEVTWPDGSYQKLENPKTNRLQTLDYEKATMIKPATPPRETIFAEVKNHELQPHSENYYDDFADQILLPHKLSALGPALANGDVNGDGYPDLYIGGGKNQSGSIYFQQASGTFELSQSNAFKNDGRFEDTDALFFDVDQDGDLDLFVTSGSYEYPENSEWLTDRLYLNDSRGNFTRDRNWEGIKSNSMTVTSADLEGDGDLDLFIGGRVVKGKYPLPPQSFLLVNEAGSLQDRTADLASELQNLGMITDAEFVDIDGDQDQDLVVVGEWMSVTFFENRNGSLVKKEMPFDEASRGWWNEITVADLNADGHQDLVLGNLGLNYKFTASVTKPFELFGGDFDANGTFEIILAKHISDTLYPVRGKMCSSAQMPSLESDFPTFQSFAEADLREIYGEKLKQSMHFQATKFENCVMMNDGQWNFTMVDLPDEAQLSAVNAFIARDVNEDGNIDLLLGGNLYGSEIETTRGDAGIGSLLLGDGTGNFEAVDHLSSGFFVNGDVRRMVYLSGEGDFVVVANNNDNVQLFRLDKTGAKQNKIALSGTD